PSMWGTNWLARDPRDVIDEIRYYYQQYRIEHVEFYDLTAIVDRRWILDFTKMLSAERLPITWRLPSGTRSEALDADVLQAMVRSGCEAIVYAPESGSPRTLARIKKKVNPERMLRSMRAAVRAGMHVRGHFIMGMPGQTLSEVAETFRFIAKMAWVGVHDVNTYFFYPYPGSEMYRELVAQGRIDPSSAAYDELLAGACFTDFKAIRSWSDHFSPAMLRVLCLGSMAFFYALSFFFWPLRPVRTFWRVVRARSDAEGSHAARRDACICALSTASDTQKVQSGPRRLTAELRAALPRRRSSGSMQRSQGDGAPSRRGMDLSLPARRSVCY